MGSPGVPLLSTWPTGVRVMPSSAADTRTTSPGASVSSSRHWSDVSVSRLSTGALRTTIEMAVRA